MQICCSYTIMTGKGNDVCTHIHHVCTYMCGTRCDPYNSVHYRTKYVFIPTWVLNYWDYTCYQKVFVYFTVFSLWYKLIYGGILLNLLLQSLWFKHYLPIRSEGTMGRQLLSSYNYYYLYKMFYFLNYTRKIY